MLVEIPVERDCLAEHMLYGQHLGFRLGMKDSGGLCIQDKHGQL